MIRSISDIRDTAKAEGLSAAQIARACDPPIPAVTVWRILKGKRQGLSKTQEILSVAIDRLLSEQAAGAPVPAISADDDDLRRAMEVG